MKKVDQGINAPILVTIENIEDFFARGKYQARLLDQKKDLAHSYIISFEDPQDMIRFLSKNKLELVATARQQPSSITSLAKKLHRSRAAIDRDLQLLESVGILKSEYVVNPGHGRYKRVSATKTQPITLQVQATI
jgi:predicted transcriptional regulator